ncbi:putative ABC transport system permease protein [Kribbella aluminosa]|uniref:ABC transport system permease protein n=1 Tax=Kribbella aluminosa TaxID=416017 RepID=A0ABS4UEU4_9ACTN|nr:FtsX-like permease family protein [Kribbella aluminosa]MBP2350125.1 putative ABC transport system permease protein [Kribbella aluminosa]
MRHSLLASLRAHLGRLVAACLAIVLGVGFGSLAMIVHSSASHGIDETVGAQYKGIDAVVYPSRATVSPADIVKAKQVPQAAAVVTLTTAYLNAAYPDQVRPTGIEIDELHDTTVIAGPGTSSGRLPTATNEIALAARQAAKHKVGVGDQLRIGSYDGKSWTLRVVGLIDDGNSVGTAPAVVTPAAMKVISPDAFVRGIALAAKPGVSQVQLADATRAVVAGELTTYTGTEFIQHEVEGYTHGIDVLGGVFGMFALIALFVACLVIGNTFTIVIAQRTREMALLRCVGASRRQVFTSVLAEASVVGVVASAIGVVFGVALSALALTLSREFDWGIPKVPLHLDVASVFVPLLLGTLATLIAAVVPARRATKVAPLAALRPEAAPAAGSRAGVLRLLAGFLLLAGGGVLLAAGAAMHQVLIGAAGGAISFLGVLAVGSLLVPALIRLLGALPARGGGVPARIAVANAVRNPKRTAATTSALLIGVTLISLTCVGISSVQKTFDVSMSQQYPVDLVVTGYKEKMPANAEQQLRDIKGITQVVPVSSVDVKAGSVDAKAGSEDLAVTGIDQDKAGSVIHNQQLAGQLEPGTALVAYRVMQGLKLTEGSQITMVSGQHKLSLTVRMSVGHLDPITVTSTDLAKLAPNAAVSGYWLATDPNANGPNVIDAVQQSIPSVKDLGVDGGLAERSTYTKIFDVLLIVGIGLLGVSVLIALVGVGNTLSLSVLERTRENALLRAMGLSRRQLRRMLAVESLLMALVAAGLGIVLGLVYGWTGTSALMGGQTVTGGVEYAVPGTLLIAIAAVAAVAGLLASVLPARRAAKVSPAGALATE